MMNEKDDTSRFTIRDEEATVPDSAYVADMENLRIQKLGTRITLVAVLIPCLLVIVLTVAYLDIKKRVISTQNTGSIGVQNLSNDLESRFSTLSLKQDQLEKQLTDQAKVLETATAAIQINLKKANDEFKQAAAAKVDQSELTDLSNKTATAISGLQKDIAQLNTAFDKFDEELAGQIQLMAEGLKKDQGRLAAVEAKTQQLGAEKLSKASMELSLGLERLALQEMVREKIQGVDKKLALLGKQLDGLNQRLNAQGRPAAATPPAAVAPLPSPPSNPPSESTTIKEQTIN